MPNRIISQSICSSESMAELTWFEQVVFIRLILSADDYGRYDARPAIIKGHLFPCEDVTVKQIQNSLTKLSINGMIYLYMVADRPYLELCAWRKYNTPRAAKSKYPDPPALVSELPDDETCKHLQTNENNGLQLPADSPVIRNSIFGIRNSDSIGIGDGESGDSAPKKNKFIPPTVDEVRDYCKENGFIVDPERFFDHYKSNGWKVGKVGMQDWKATLRNWERKERKEKGDGESGSKYSELGKKIGTRL